LWAAVDLSLIVLAPDIGSALRQRSDKTHRWALRQMRMFQPAP